MAAARSQYRPTRADLAALLRLAAPMVLIQVGLMLMGVVDTIMVGRVSPAALAAVALGNMYFFVITIFGLGVLMALDPIVAQALGARDELAVSRGSAARPRAVGRADGAGVAADARGRARAHASSASPPR